MYEKIPLSDVIIFLPGIIGSVLEKDGKEVWGLSCRSIWNVLRTLGGSIQELRIVHDDPDVDDLGDRVRATGLIPDVRIVPGLVKIDGYSRISKFIQQNFDVQKGTIWQKKPANFFEFPYDWRRDNRVSARQLKRFIDFALPAWRDETGNKNAKTILLAHSMGGVVSRYYLENLGGWQSCRALITFGTPYRGSVNALNYLANGYKKFGVELTDVMRSFTSVYQLLPIYRVLFNRQEYKRVCEVSGIPGIDQSRAAAALQFHRDIEAAVNQNQKIDPYKDEFVTLPFVGTRQRTMQSAELKDGKLVVSHEVPARMNKLLNDGDGTVPLLSAIPIELSNEYRDTFMPEKHASLQNNASLLDHLYERLKQFERGDISAYRGPQRDEGLPGKSAISLEVDDIYLADETVTVQANLINPVNSQVKLITQITDTETGTKSRHEMREKDGNWTLELPDLFAGVYRILVESSYAGPGAPPPVHDVFEVGG